MKNLRKFSTTAEYLAYKKSTDIILPNVSYVEETGKVFYNSLRNTVGTYVYSDLTLGVDPSPSGKTVIGVTVIPAFATPDGMARFMHINGFSKDNLDDELMFYPENSEDAVPDSIKNNLHGVSKAPYVNNGSTVTNTVQGITDTISASSVTSTQMHIEMPEKYLEHINSAHLKPSAIDGLNIYTSSPIGINDATYVLPSPYLADDSLNPNYRVAGTITADWDAETNNQLLKNIKGTVFQKAAQFSTAGTNTGEWYVPTINELAFMWAKLDTICKAIEKAGGEARLHKEFSDGDFDMISFYLQSSTYNCVSDGALLAWQANFFGYSGGALSSAGWNIPLQEKYSLVQFHKI